MRKIFFYMFKQAAGMNRIKMLLWGQFKCPVATKVFSYIMDNTTRNAFCCCSQIPSYLV